MPHIQQIGMLSKLDTDEKTLIFCCLSVIQLRKSAESNHNIQHNKDAVSDVKHHSLHFVVLASLCVAEGCHFGWNSRALVGIFRQRDERLSLFEMQAKNS